MPRLMKSIETDFEMNQEEWPTIRASALWIILFWASLISFCFTLGPNPGFYSELIFVISFTCLTYEDLRTREPIDLWTNLSHAYGIFLAIFYIGWLNHLCEGSTLAWFTVAGIACSVIHKIPRSIAYFFNHYDEDGKSPHGFFHDMILHSWIGALVLVILGILGALLKGMWRILCIIGVFIRDVAVYYGCRYKSGTEDVVD